MNRLGSNRHKASTSEEEIQLLFDEYEPWEEKKIW